MNSTCDACTKNCSKSSTVNATLLNALNSEEDPECSPIYYVVDTIATHSKKLHKVVNSLKDTVNESKNDVIVTAPNSIEVNDLCQCNI